MIEDPLQQAKQQLRQAMRERRRNRPDKDETSRRLWQHLRAVDAFAQASTLMFYVDIHSEVRTRDVLREYLDGAGAATQIAVPYCDDDTILRPLLLTHFDELVPAAYGILEPRDDLRDLPERIVDPRAIDVALVPGVAFDRSGRRLGSGRGYYDRLIPKLRRDVVLIGLAFECQLVDDVPTGQHDAPMDIVVTETAVYRCGD